jgi:hypothetical protein
VPPVGALDQPRRVLSWIREHPWGAVAITAGAILICAWIAWAIVVAGEHGAREAVGVLIVWPAIVVALALLALLVVGIYRLLRPRESGPVDAGPGRAADDEPVEEPEAAR